MAAGTGAPTKVFISYRRDDSAPYAGRLYDRLADAVGAENIFMDVDSISFGLDFAEAIRTAVASCDVLLAMIGPEWLTISERGRRRLDDPDDFVRLEIEAALERNVRVVPVLVDEAELPTREQLPESLQPLVRRQTLRLSHDQFRIETQRLIDDLLRLSGTAAALPPNAPPPPDASAPLPPPQAATSGPVVKALVEQAKILTLSVELAQSHVIEIDNTNFFGLIKVDGQQVVKKVNPEGTHNLVVDDGGTQTLLNLSFGTTWSAALKDVVLRLGDQVLYENEKL
jgi:hypothetical protein